MADSDVIITLVDDGTISSPPPEPTPEPAPVEPVAAPVAAPTPPSDDPRHAIEEMREQLRRQEERTSAALAESERRLRDAEDYASRVAADAGSAVRREVDANLDAITGTLSAHKSTLTSLQSSYASALKDGDWDRAADINTKVSTTTAQIAALEAGQRELEVAKKQQPAAPTGQPRQTQPQFTFSNDTAWSNAEFEAFIGSRTPQTAAWLRGNPRYASDPGFRRQVMAAHNYAEAKGVRPDTTDYFRMIEDTTGQANPSAPTRNREQPMTEQPPAQPPAAPRQPPTPAAPANRTVPNAAPGGGIRITLTEEEQKIARATLPPEIIGKNPDGTPRDPLVVYAQRKAEQAKGGTFRTETAGGPTSKSQAILRIGR